MARQKKFKCGPLYGMLESALKHYDDVSWLGSESLLSSPYLIGPLLQENEDVAEMEIRGRRLQILLRESIEASEPYYREILRKTFLTGRKRLKGIWDELTISEPTYHRDRKQAIAALEKVVVDYLQPALRLEHPADVTQIIGREQDLAHSLDALGQAKSVALTGPGGIGKTILGSYLAHQLAPRPTFWFTFYPGLNDHLDAVLFSLGYFLHQQGVSNLWSQILAQQESGKPLDLYLAQSQLRHDLDQLQPQLPLLCFDEVDLLGLGTNEAHTQLCTFLERLRGLTPLLLMGQQCQIDTALPLRLTPFSQREMGIWLERHRIQYTPERLSQLESYTEGNPRLLQLFITLYEMGEPFDDVMSQLQSYAPVEFLLNRICQRLDAQEQKLLVALSVFRRPVPREIDWCYKNAQGVWIRLIERQLVRDDGGALSLNPTYRALIYRLLSTEQREALHHNAAQIRHLLHDQTAAAYHYIAANRPEEAIQLWRDHQEAEIQRGQARTAQRLFGTLSDTDLSPRIRETLCLIRSDLAFRVGDLEEAKEILRNTVWETPFLGIEADALAGTLASLQNEFEVAQSAYQEGLDRAYTFCEKQIPLLHKEMGWVYMRQDNLDDAWRESEIARYEVENLQGTIQKRRRNFLQAEQHYLAALELAESMGYQEGLAKTYNSLSSIYGFQERIDDAVTMHKQAIDIYQQIHRLVEVAGSQTNLALIYLKNQDFTQAIHFAQESLDTFTILNIPRGQALACQILAESHLGLEQLDQARSYAGQVMETEEIEMIPDALRVLGEVELKRGSHAKAQQNIQQSIRLAVENQDPFLEAYGWRALGQVQQSQYNIVEARELFGKAMFLFQEMGLENEVEKTRAVQGHR